MDRIAAELHELSDRMGENIYENVRDGMEREEKLKDKVECAKEAGRGLKAEYDAEIRIRYEELQAKREELRRRYEKVLQERGAVGERLIRAFPGMESRRYKAALLELKENIRSRKK